LGAAISAKIGVGEKMGRIEEAPFWEHKGIRVVFDPEWRCRRQEPLPTKAWIKTFYEKRYFQEVKDGWDELQNEEREFWERIFEDKRVNLEELLPGGSAPWKCLDVGCGNGMFLAYLQRRGWKVRGIEPSPLARLARDKYGVECSPDFIENVPVPSAEDKFHVVHVADLLEHVLEPYELLRKCHAFLRPDGIFLLDHGLDFNPFQLSAVEQMGLPCWWIAPEHITYWTHDQVVGALQREGFEIVRKESDFPIDLLLLMGIDYVSHPERGREAHRMRENFERVLSKTGRDDVRRRFYRQLASVGLGRQIRFYCRPGKT